jgi:hypothetical protein
MDTAGDQTCHHSMCVIHYSHQTHISYIGFSAIISDFCCFRFAAFSGFCPDVAVFEKKL